MLLCRLGQRLDPGQIDERQQEDWKESEGLLHREEPLSHPNPEEEDSEKQMDQVCVNSAGRYKIVYNA